MARYFRDSRIVVFSTGNVYPFVSPEQGGCVESDAPSPVGEYAQSCLGRERIFEFFSNQFYTIFSVGEQRRRSPFERNSSNWVT